MATDKKLNPQTPGEPIVEAVETVETAETNAIESEADEAEADEAEADEAELTLAEQIQALNDRVTALEQSTPINRPQRKHGGSLPHPDDIDPDAIRSPVLTSEGWVSPSGYGSNPNGPK
jgi:hypothetical protein